MTQANEPITQAGIDTAETVGELIQEMLTVEWSFSELEDSPSEPYVLDEDGRFAAKIAAELDAKDAEIARLKPAAEAWWAMERWAATGDVQHRLESQAAAKRAHEATS